MSLAEITAAAAALSEEERAELMKSLAEQAKPKKVFKPRRELQEKWRKIMQENLAPFGGAEGYLKLIRGHDDDDRS